ncbi:site-specific integrase [Candidatus Woesearchaeota archaeon]|nr:site-specific integrase [Candidatus Woesearchaeota archaeon]
MAAKKKDKHSGSYVKPQEKAGFFTAEALLKGIKNQRNRLIIRLLSSSGCRTNELVNIRLDDIDAEAGMLTIRAENTKSKTKRSIPLQKKLAAELKRSSCAGSAYVFSSSSGRKLSTRSIRKILAKHSETAGSKITTADLRKEFIRKEVRKGKTIEEIKNIAGLKRLDRKEHITPEEFKVIIRQAKDKRDHLILRILFETGCTLKELLAIRRKDARPDMYSLVIKGVKKRSVHISKGLCREIKSYVLRTGLSQKDFLLSSRQSMSISDRRVFQIIKHYSKKAGVKTAGPRILRHSCIASSIANGRSVDEISMQTGIAHLGRFHLYGTLKTAKKTRNRQNIARTGSEYG